jgi:hypothetical protein
MSAKKERKKEKYFVLSGNYSVHFIDQPFIACAIFYG